MFAAFGRGGRVAMPGLLQGPAGRGPVWNPGLGQPEDSSSPGGQIPLDLRTRCRRRDARHRSSHR